MKKSFPTEKEKYARFLESEIYAPIGNKMVDNQIVNGEMGRRIPLGRNVSSMEMLNPEARRQLKEMLEHQMKEKEFTLQ